MNSFLLRVSGLGMVLAFACAASVCAQENRLVPCDDTGPGRPVLKQKSAPAADPATATDQVPCPRSPQTPKAKTIALKLEGSAALSVSDVYRHLRDKRIDLPSNIANEPQFTEPAAAEIKQLLSSRGYRQSTVGWRVDELPGVERTLIFVIDEGPVLKISEYRFVGNRVFSNGQLVDEFGKCITPYAGENYSPEVLDYCRHRLGQFIRSRGYLQARIDDPGIEETASGAIVTTRIDEGVPYRLGQIKIEGVTDDAARQFRAMLGLKQGDQINGDVLAKWAYEDLKALFGEKGYIQYTAEIQPEFKMLPEGAAGIVDFIVTIDPGDRFILRKIEFKGEHVPAEVAEQMTIHAGNVYNQKLFEQSIDKLNSLGLFEQIDKDRDADFRTNEEEHLIDVAIKITRRRNQ